MVPLPTEYVLYEIQISSSLLSFQAAVHTHVSAIDFYVLHDGKFILIIL